MSQISQNDESHLEYLNVFKQILNSNDKESKYRLVIKHKILAKLEIALQHEIKSLGDLERLTADFNSQSIGLTFNLNRSLCIKSLSELLSLFLKDINIRPKFKSRLILTVLNSYQTTSTPVQPNNSPGIIGIKMARLTVLIKHLARLTI